MRQTACLVLNPIKINKIAATFNCMTMGCAIKDDSILNYVWP